MIEIEGDKVTIFVVCIIAALLFVAIGGFAGFSFAGICAGLAAVHRPKRD